MWTRACCNSCSKWKRSWRKPAPATTLSPQWCIGLEERLNHLRPLLRQNQLEAVDAALSLNAGRLATARMQQATLNRQFLQQPGLIKQYEALQQRLEIAKQNLAGLVSAREKFQLEIAQRTVPWRVLAEPTINPDPIEPSVPATWPLGPSSVWLPEPQQACCATAWTMCSTTPAK